MNKNKKSPETITIAGREIKCEIKNIDIFKVFLNRKQIKKESYEE